MQHEIYIIDTMTVTRFFFSIIRFCFSLLLKSIPITGWKVLIIPHTPRSLTSRMKGKDLACYNSVSNLLWSLFVLGQGKNTKDKKKHPLYFNVPEGFFKEGLHCSHYFSSVSVPFLCLCEKVLLALSFLKYNGNNMLSFILVKHHLFKWKKTWNTGIMSGQSFVFVIVIKDLYCLIILIFLEKMYLSNPSAKLHMYREVSVSRVTQPIR